MSADHETASPQVHNLRIQSFEPLITPDAILETMPMTSLARTVVQQSRAALRAALRGDSERFVVITGPCSIHDRDAALEYGQRLAAINQQLSDRMLIIMRVYFEKPRTTVGWKGLINDPHLDGTCDIHEGLRRARQILLDLNALGLPCATEFLDPVVPQYTADLVSWAAVGARTTESQTHREMASGLSMPVGFKNATDGSLQVALNAMQSAQGSHAFFGVGPTGHSCVVRTTGNPYAHLVLRGGSDGSNYSRAHIAYTKVLVEDLSINRPILIDCSHGNSNKDYRKQPAVFEAVLEQVKNGERAIVGAMLESNLVAGHQKLGTGAEHLAYGQSITDGCIDWQTTERLLCEAHDSLV